MLSVLRGAGALRVSCLFCACVWLFLLCRVHANTVKSSAGSAIWGPTPPSSSRTRVCVASWGLTVTCPSDPQIHAKHAVSQGSGRASCLGHGSIPVSRSLPRGCNLCSAYGPQVPWDDTTISEKCMTLSLSKVGSVQT